MGNRPSNEGPEEGFRWLELNEGDVRYLARKHWRLIVLMPLAACLAALAYCLLATPLYTTSALLYLRPNFDKDLQVEAVFSKLEDDDSLRSLEKAVVSDTTILRMVAKLELREDPGYLMRKPENVEWLSDSKLLKKVRKRYEAKVIPTTRVLKLTVSDPSPERARLIADTLILEFLGRLREELNKEKELLRETLTLQAGRALQEAMKSEAALEAFRVQNPDFLVEQDSTVFEERVLQYGRELNQAKSDSSRLKGTVEAMLLIDPESNPFQIFEIVGTRNNQSVSELLKMHATAEAELAKAKQLYGIRNPNYRVAEQSLEQVQRSLRNYAAELKASAMSDYTASLHKAEQLQAALSELQSDFVGYKTKSAGFRGLKSEVEKNWSVHSELQKKILNLTLNPGVSPMVAIPLSEPVVPHKPSHPSKLVYGGGALVLSILLILGYMVFDNRHGMPFTHAGQVQPVLGVAAIGVVEQLEAGRPGGQPVLQTGARFVGLPVALGNHRMVHFFSMLHSEYLHQIPAALAETFARSGYNTLVVTVRNLLDLPGTTEEAAATREIVLELPVAGREKGEFAAYLPPRQFELPVAALVHREEFRSFLKRLLGDFERVVFDTTGIAEPEAILAVAKEIRSNVVIVSEEGILRPEAASFLERMRAEGVEGIAATYVRRARERKGRRGPAKPCAAPPWAEFPARVEPLRSLERNGMARSR